LSVKEENMYNLSCQNSTKRSRLQYAVPVDCGNSKRQAAIFILIFRDVCQKCFPGCSKLVKKVLLRHFNIVIFLMCYA